MHDIWFASKIIVSLKEKIGKIDNYKAVTVNIVLGPFTHVTPESLSSAFSMLGEKDGFGGVKLNIRKDKARIKCRKCKTSVEIASPVGACPACGTDDFELENSEEFIIESIEAE
ncbi:MAG: hydrogenase maturation nickel metallochaperone HypA [Candidatus Omnitrophica bacterium]|nr:hydrogenase maturation nickel metallochaperone HypA [Candidatus Omnitrophota bacterium]